MVAPPAGSARQPCREAFRVDHSVPVVLVAAGTGLAPFRGAAADRLAALAEGAELPPGLCYFGCDAPDADFLHAEELIAAGRYVEDVYAAG